MFTDTEIGLTMAHSRSMNAFASEVQAVLNRKDAELDALLSQIETLQSALRREQAARMAAELNLGRLERRLTRQH